MRGSIWFLISVCVQLYNSLQLQLPKDGIKESFQGASLAQTSQKKTHSCKNIIEKLHYEPAVSGRWGSSGGYPSPERTSFKFKFARSCRENTARIAAGSSFRRSVATRIRHNGFFKATLVLHWLLALEQADSRLLWNVRPALADGIHQPDRLSEPKLGEAQISQTATDSGFPKGKEDECYYRWWWPEWQRQGKATKGWQQHVAPSAKALPQPPKSTAVALPSGAPSTSSTASSAEKNLENLVLALQSSSVELPPGVRDLVRQHSEQSTRMTAQTLHKAVNAQTAARRELRKIKDQRRSYLGSWAHYITTLAETLAKQIAEQEETLNNFQEAEDAWHQQLKAASEDLARLATEKPETSAELEADEMDAEEEEASNAKTVAALASHREQQQRLLETLTQATQNAKALASAQREGSRTPRRRGAQPIPVDSSSEDAPVAPVPGKA